MTEELSPAERQVLGAAILEGRDQWAERGRPALADWHNERLIELDNEAADRRTEIDTLDRQLLGLPDVGVAEIISD
tara:strand:+ start:2480 stop:2707 length:228 start_codon:yes stop_codon:yes gene_type:complete